MATAKMTLSVVAACLIFVSCAVITADGGLISGVVNRLNGICNPPPGEWQDGTGTYYAGGHGGACGYGGLGYDAFAENYAAVSQLLWSSGSACGTCLEIRCTTPAGACVAGRVIKVTVTDFCPPTYPNLAHCGTDKHHIDIGQNVFPMIAAKSVGVIGLQYRRVPCVVLPSITVSMRGNAYGWLELIVLNVPGAGAIATLEIQSSGGAWESCTHSWGGSFSRTGDRLQTPISLRISVVGVCKFVAQDCIKSLNFGSSVSCTYS